MGNDCIYHGDDNDFIKGNGGSNQLYSEMGTERLMGKQGEEDIR